MDDVISAAINELPVRGGDGPDVLGHGVMTLADRIFLYRSLSALCGAGVPVHDALDSVASVMMEPISHEKEGPRIRHYAEKAARELEGTPGRRSGRTLGALLDDVGFVIDDVERCMFALDPLSVEPRDLAVTFRGALEFLMHVQSTARGARR